MRTRVMALLAAFTTGCAALEAQSLPAALPFIPAVVTQKVFKTEAIQKRVMTASKITAARVHVNPAKMNGTQKKSPEDPFGIAGYETESTVPLRASQEVRLRTLLASPSSYSFGNAPGCLPDYGVVFTFGEGKDAVQAAFCFHCAQFAVLDGEEWVNEDSFHPMRAQLLLLCRELFPKDKALAELK